MRSCELQAKKVTPLDFLCPVNVHLPLTVGDAKRWVVCMIYVRILSVFNIEFDVGDDEIAVTEALKNS